jgi:hypothetical protein
MSRNWGKENTARKRKCNRERKGTKEAGDN